MSELLQTFIIIIIFRPGTKSGVFKNSRNIKLAEMTNPVDPWNNHRAGELH